MNDSSFYKPIFLEKFLLDYSCFTNVLLSTVQQSE